MKYYFFNCQVEPTLEEVGGKAKSLIELTKKGFEVPKGAVLTVDFFNEWIDELRRGETSALTWTDPESFPELADRLKRKAEDFEFSSEQRTVISQVIGELDGGGLFAVRSSSPEEDMAGASFAGGYETVLGVAETEIEDAVKLAFLSCLDKRVFYYKHQSGFDTSQVRIAVIIQEQIASDASGVGFSLNPMNNAYDEAVINANTGLGESVVSGLVTPDEYVVDKNTMQMISVKPGSKEKAIVLAVGGGTETVEGMKGELSLSEKQVVELTGLIAEVESSYGFPVDIEWAFANDRLYLLQSRPVTTYIPLPEEMQTRVGEQKVLYIDGSLTKQGITTPISVMGCDAIEITQGIMFTDMMGKDTTEDIKWGLAATRGGRMYVNASSSMRFQGKKRIVNMWKTVDVVTARVLEELDLEEYIPKKLPEVLKGAMWGTVKNNIGAVKYMRQAAKDPDGYKKWYQPFEDEFDSYLSGIITSGIAVRQAPQEIFSRFIDLLGKMLPMTYAAELARKAIAKQLEKSFPDDADLMKYLERSLPDNVTIDMGLMMYELAVMDEVASNDEDEICRIIDEKAYSKTFGNLWQEFVDTYGCRTTNELDVGVARSYEKVDVIAAQLKSMASVEDEFSPKRIYEESRQLREQTYDRICSGLQGSDLRKFKRKYNTLVKLGGKREALKYWYVRSLTAIRELLLAEADRLVEKGKLKDREDVFRLHFTELLDTDRLSCEEIYCLIGANMEYYSLLSRVKEFPKLIDSRGRILTLPHVEPKEGEVVGQPISPGIVTGRVKVLHAPDEKPLLPGEIMVTKATDPGWTPLFINASAILLEVGGLLQHGALVAREYGKPCIAGVENAMNLFEDGQMVRVDAARGVITLLENSDEEADA